MRCAFVWLRRTWVSCCRIAGAGRRGERRRGLLYFLFGSVTPVGGMAELADARALGARTARCEGSSPSSPTKHRHACPDAVEARAMNGIASSIPDNAADSAGRASYVPQPAPPSSGRAVPRTNHTGLALILAAGLHETRSFCHPLPMSARPSISGCPSCSWVWESSDRWSVRTMVTCAGTRFVGSDVARVTIAVERVVRAIGG